MERTGVLRRLIHTAGQIAALGYEARETEVERTLEQAEAALFAVRRSHLLGQARSPLLRDALSAMFERLEQVSQRRGTLTGVPTGFTDLDRLLGGLQPSDLIVLAARPSVGKSACALSIAYHAAVRHQQRVGIFSLEMSQEQLLLRLMAMDASVDQQRLRMGWIEDDDWERIVEAMSTLAQAPILLDDTAGLSAWQVRSKARQWVVEYGEVDLLIVDYLQLMRAGDGNVKRQENRVQIIDEIAHELKALARELHLPVLALAQLSRAVEQRHSKVPQPSDLRESGAIESAADVVLLLYRDDVYHPETQRRNQADLIVAKHRNGPVGEVVLYFEKHLTRFRDLEASSSSPPLRPAERRKTPRHDERASERKQLPDHDARKDDLSPEYLASQGLLFYNEGEAPESRREMKILLKETAERETVCLMKPRHPTTPTCWMEKIPQKWRA